MIFFENKKLNGYNIVKKQNLFTYSTALFQILVLSRKPNLGVKLSKGGREHQKYL